jgi:hypothetical protein
MKNLKILTMHQLAKVTNFSNLEMKEMGDFSKMKTSAIGV